MLKRRAFLLLGAVASFAAVRQAQAFFSGGIGVAGLLNRQVPSITSISPNNGPPAGGTAVTMGGFSFTGVTGVTFGGIPATNVVVTGNDVLTCTTPAVANGPANVVVTNPVGPSSPVVFTFGAAPVVSTITPPSGPTAGGTAVTIGGSGFTGATAVTIGGAPATPFTIVDDGHITTTPPAGSGVGAVAVTNPNGTGTLAAAFTYTGTFSASIPLGGGAFTVQQHGGSGGPVANADG